MLIEAVDFPIRYQWPGGEIRLLPGKPVQVDEERGKKVLAKCGPKVRAVQPFDVGDCLSYQVAQDPQQGPFRVAEVAPDLSHGQWWALVEKPGSLAWIHERIMTKVESKGSSRTF